MDNLLISGETIFGLVSKSIFIGSSTENFSGSGANDLAIAAPLASPIPTAASLNGTYTIIDMDSPFVQTQGGSAEVRDMLMTLTANGNGTISGSNKGYVGTSLMTQSISAKYIFQNGAGILEFPTSSNINTLIQGNHYIYISPDGNFVFGGSPNGWDIFVGVKNGSGTPANFGGLYYQAGMDFSFSSGGLDSYYGSFKALGTNTAQPNILGHQRLASTTSPNPFDFTYIDGYTFNSDGTSDDTNTGQHYVYGLNGALRVGFGNSPTLGINVALAAPTFTNQSGVFLDPTGIINAASYALSTADLAPGEFVIMTGSNLAPSFEQSTGGFAATLNGVQVLIDGIPAPIYYVFPDEIAVLVPYGVTPGVATIQVINGSAKSNVVTLFVGLSQPGIFSETVNGVTYARAQRVSDNSIISPTNQALSGDVLNVFVTGLGSLTTPISDGAVSPANDTTSNTFNAFIGGVPATVSFAGLEKGFTGVYLVTLTVPTGLTAGDNVLEITGPDADNFEVQISIGTGTAAAAVPETRLRERVNGDTGNTLHARPHNLTGPNRQKERVLPHELERTQKPLDSAIRQRSN